MSNSYSDYVTNELSPARRVFSWVVFPGTLALMLGGCMWAMTVWPDRPPEVFVLVFAVSTALWAFVLEIVHPHTPRWREARDDFWTDLTHMLVSEVLPPQVFNALFHSALVVGAVWLAERVGFGLWPASWPWVAQLLLALVISELPYYWWHRMCHEVPLLWRLHATHHSAERLYWLNAGRFHPLDTIFGYALQATPLILLGCPAEVLALFTLFVAVHGLFQHANIEVRLGPLNYLFSMAELHRWHHSQRLEDANKNFGGNLIVWDIVFRTRHLPKDRTHDPEDVGLHGMPNFPRTWWGQILSPFRWAKMKAEALVDLE